MVGVNRKVSRSQKSGRFNLYMQIAAATEQ